MRAVPPSPTSVLFLLPTIPCLPRRSPCTSHPMVVFTPPYPAFFPHPAYPTTAFYALPVPLPPIFPLRLFCVPPAALPPCLYLPFFPISFAFLTPACISTTVLPCAPTFFLGSECSLHLVVHFLLALCPSLRPCWTVTTLVLLWLLPCMSLAHLHCTGTAPFAS